MEEVVAQEDNNLKNQKLMKIKINGIIQQNKMNQLRHRDLELGMILMHLVVHHRKNLKKKIKKQLLVDYLVYFNF